MADHKHDHHAHHHHPVVNATVKALTMAVDALTKALTTTTASPDIQGHDHHVMDQSKQAAMDMDHSGHSMGMNMDMNCTCCMDMGGMDMGGMMDYFHTGLNQTILFEEWKVQTAGGMVGAVIVVILLALVYEGLKFLREQLYRQQYTRLTYTTCAVTGNSMQPQEGPAELHKIAETRILSWPHLLQTSLHMTQVLLSYFLMLIFMTFNVWLCLGVLIGSGIGFFLFGWRKSTVVDISDHCH